MWAASRNSLVAWAAAAMCLSVSSVAGAGSPVNLNDRQLDGVTAAQGGAYANAAAAAAGLGLRVFGGTDTTAVTEVGSPNNDGPFGGSTAQATAYGFGGGLNGVLPGAGSASATTQTIAPGNVAVTIGTNYTVYGIGTMVQGSISSSTGLFVPGVQ